MYRKIAAFATAATLALPVTLWAQTAPTVKDIKVEVDMAAVQSAEAAKYWGNLSNDLQSAILANLVGQVADDGANITVDISEVELANGFATAVGIGNTVLKGTVNQTHETNNGRFNAYELTVDMNQTLPALGEGFDLTAADVDTSKVYQAMINTFAKHVAANVK